MGKHKTETVDDDEETRRKRESQNGDSAFKHKRSKSASERDLEISWGGIVHSAKKPTGTGVHTSTITTRIHGVRNSFHDQSTYIHKNTSSNNRASLEQDIEQLQLRLREERAMRTVLEKAMGRASSTLSPGHRHFAAQTKDLVTEIELLEEEVANREQHVLTLYRNIFEQCVSRSSSEQSSGISSPAHMKQPSRKHPSIISSAFCSSKNFPPRPWHALVNINDLNKRSSKSNDTPQIIGRKDVGAVKNCLDPRKSHVKASARGKSPMQQTLKDHLYQCPSRLSQEMVRCMASVYCWLCKTAASSQSGKKRLPKLSRSSTSVYNPQKSTIEVQEWSCKSLVEISWISKDKSQFSKASYAISNYRLLVEQLERITLDQIENSAKLAFWINVYNALIMHAYLAYGIPQNSLRRLALFHKSAYNIGGQIISANAIEHFIFCFRTPRVGRWLETIVSSALRKKSVEERQIISSKFGLPNPEPLLCFALCTGALSDPVLKVYTASNIREELEAATREFLQANVMVKKSKRVLIPKVVERFSREASVGGTDELLKWVSERVDRMHCDSIKKCMQLKKSSQIIHWIPYTSRFRYVFSKELTDKPWWV